MLKHISVEDWHALYHNGDLIYSWFNTKLDKVANMQDLLDALSREGVNFSEHGVIREYAGKNVRERLIKDKGWPATYEELDEMRDMGLYALSE